MSSAEGNFAVVEYLHQAMDLTSADARTRGNCALRWASENGHVAVVKYLQQWMGVGAS